MNSRWQRFDETEEELRSPGSWLAERDDDDPDPDAGDPDEGPRK